MISSLTKHQEYAHSTPYEFHFWQANDYMEYVYVHRDLAGCGVDLMYTIRQYHNELWQVSGCVAYSGAPRYWRMSGSHRLDILDGGFAWFESAREAIFEHIHFMIEEVILLDLPLTTPRSTKHHNNPTFRSKASFKHGLYRARRAYKRMLSAMRKQHRAERIEDEIISRSPAYAFDVECYHAAQIRFYDLAKMWRMNLNTNDDGQLDIALSTLPRPDTRPAPHGIIARIAVSYSWRFPAYPRNRQERLNTYHDLKELYTYA